MLLRVLSFPVRNGKEYSNDDCRKIFKNFALRLLSVAFGSIIYYIVIQTVITLGLDANLLKLLSAVIVAIFLAIPYWKRQYAQKHMRKPKGGKTNA